MSRIAKAPIRIPVGIEVKINNSLISIKGKKGILFHAIHKDVNIQYNDNYLIFLPCEHCINAWSLAGTTRALINNMVIGVTDGFSKKLILNGIGYRAIIKNNIIDLFLGFSHVIHHVLPKGITAESSNPNEIIITGCDKQMVGQAAANIRAYRPPEPYKGKGIRYSEELLHNKEAKKK